jgi:hypothetical protein
MMLYKGAAADVVGGCIHFLLVGGRRSSGSLLECQVDKSEESVANCVVGATVELFVGGTKGSQLGVGAVVGPALGLVADVMLMA